MGRAYRSALRARCAVVQPARAAALALTLALAGCAGWRGAPAPVETRAVESRSAQAPSIAGPGADAPGAPAHPASRWIAAGFDELPGWRDDRLRDWWPALRRGCAVSPPPAWRALCAQALAAPPFADDDALRDWLQARLAPWRIEPADGGASSGLLTGYFEPLREARRLPQGAFRVPLHAPPADLATRRPWYTRQQADTLPAAQAALRGREIAYLADPLDVLMLQIQGSGRLRIVEPDGRERLVRLAYAGHNDQPYRSIGRWLVDAGELPLAQASWTGIRAWSERNPARRQELLWANPRLVFFREEPLADASVGPRGAQGVPLTAQRSIAVDPQSIPYGTPVWLDSTEPMGSAPLRRLVMAQDTGSAIVGAVRADYFWGDGAQAEQQASRMRQPLRLWVLWPR